MLTRGVQRLSVYVSVSVELTQFPLIELNCIWMGIKTEIHQTNRKVYFNFPIANMNCVNYKHLFFYIIALFNTT